MACLLVLRNFPRILNPFFIQRFSLFPFGIFAYEMFKLASDIFDVLPFVGVWTLDMWHRPEKTSTKLSLKKLWPSFDHLAFQKSSHFSFKWEENWLFLGVMFYRICLLAPYQCYDIRFIALVFVVHESYASSLAPHFQKSLLSNRYDCPEFPL